MKKTIALLLALVMSLSLLAGCGGGSTPETQAPATQPAAPVAAETVAEAAVAGIGEKGVDLNGKRPDSASPPWTPSSS